MSQRTLQQREADCLAAIRKKGPLRRAAEVVGVDVEARTVELSFSSEAEVSRWGWVEVLSHDPGAARLERLNDGGAFLNNHDWTDQRGVVVPGSARIDPEARKGRATVRLSRSAAGEELLQDMADQIRTKVSVGYEIRAVKLTEEREGLDVYTVTDWEPLEVSSVSVPADITVGVGRALEIPAEDRAPSPEEDGGTRMAPTPKVEITAPTGDRRLMDEKEQQQAREAAQRAGADAERARVRAINQLAEKFGRAVDNVEALVRGAINDGHDEAQFQRTLLEAVNARAARPLSEQAQGSDIGLTEKEVRNYSLVRVIRALSEPTDKRAQKEAAFEFEASEAAREKQEKKSERFVVPTDILRRSVYGEINTRVMTTGTAGGTIGNTGGYGVATTLMAASFIEILRNRATIMKMGATLGGLVGNVDIPKQTGKATGYWIGEDDDTTETGIELGQIAMTPKTLGGYSEVTRKLILQSSLDVEALLRRDLAIGLALAADSAGYYGTGAGNQPLGIANHTGINAVAFAGNAPTFSELVQMETQIAIDNADVDSMVYVSTPGFRGYAKTTLKFAVNGSGTIWEPGNQVNGYNALITNQIQVGDVFHGNFADFLVGMWGGLELLVDPYSNSKKGRLRIVMFQDMDFAVRRTESFCLGRKAGS